MDQASEEAGPRSEATDINNAGGWHTQYTHTHDWTIFIYKKKQYKIWSNMVKMLFDDQNNSFFFSGEPASQPQPTSHITNLQDVSLRCVSCIVVTRGCWSGGGIKTKLQQ